MLLEQMVMDGEFVKAFITQHRMFIQMNHTRWMLHDQNTAKNEGLQ